MNSATLAVLKGEEARVEGKGETGLEDGGVGFGLIVERGVDDDVAPANGLHPQLGGGKAEIIIGGDPQGNGLKQENGGLGRDFPEVDLRGFVLPGIEADGMPELGFEPKPVHKMKLSQLFLLQLAEVDDEGITVDLGRMGSVGGGGRHHGDGPVGGSPEEDLRTKGEIKGADHRAGGEVGQFQVGGVGNESFALGDHGPVHGHQIDGGPVVSRLEGKGLGLLLTGDEKLVHFPVFAGLKGEASGATEGNGGWGGLGIRRKGEPKHAGFTPRNEELGRNGGEGGQGLPLGTGPGKGPAEGGVAGETGKGEKAAEDHEGGGHCSEGGPVGRSSVEGVLEGKPGNFRLHPFEGGGVEGGGIAWLGLVALAGQLDDAEETVSRSSEAVPDLPGKPFDGVRATEGKEVDHPGEGEGGRPTRAGEGDTGPVRVSHTRSETKRANQERERESRRKEPNLREKIFRDRRVRDARASSSAGGNGSLFWFIFRFRFLPSDFRPQIIPTSLRPVQ